MGSAGTRAVAVATACAVASFAAYAAVLGARDANVALLAVDGPVPALALVFTATALAAPFLAIVAVLVAAVAIWSVRRGTPRDAALIAVFAAAMTAVLLARSVAAFLLAWETMSLVSAFLVAAHHERRDVRRAAFAYLLVAQTGALCVLAALWVLAAAAGDATFAASARDAASLPPAVRDGAFVLALLGFGSKAGLVPLHVWLPRAHPVAPSAASALLSGAMLAVALYGLLTVVLQLAAPAPAWWGVVLVACGLLSALAGALYAVVERDLKRLLAYSSVENVGVIVVAIGIALVAQARGDAVLAGLALTGALLHACNHAAFKGLLFLGAGAVLERTGTADLERLGGLWRPLGALAPLLLIGFLAAAGIPPFNGFVSEWLVLRSLVAALASWHAAVPYAALALVTIAGLALTGGLALAAAVAAFGVGILGGARVERANDATPERVGAATVALGVLAAACIVPGVFPQLAVAPLARIAVAALGGDAPAILAAVPSLPWLPLGLALLPLGGALACVVLGARRGVRSVPTWTCGSPVTPAAQYTVTAFTKPLRIVFAFALLPQRRRITKGSPWFPTRIAYRTEPRYLVDEGARALSSLALHLARRSRALQSGSLRLYLAYAVVALIAVVAVAR
jgi:hydrogenase-4 component B